MESEWKRNETGKENKIQIYWSQYQLEWNRNGMELSQQKKSMQNRMDMEQKQNGNGKEKKWTNLLKVKFTGMEQKWKGNGMEL